MELDVRSRHWIVTFTVDDVDTVNEATVLGDGSISTFELVHAKLSRTNGTCSVWFTFKNAQRASTLSRVFDEHKHVVVKRVTHAVFPQFKEVASDRELVVTSPLCHGTTDDTLDPPRVVDAGTDSDSDQELRSLMRQRKVLRRRVKALTQAQVELTQVNDDIAKMVSS